MPQPVYELRAVTVTLGERQVLGPLDLTLEPGSFTAIVGPNGSGKTTLLRTLTGVVRPSAGDVLLHGQVLADHKTPEIARAVGVVPQTFSLDFSFTVEEMVEMGRYAQSTHSPQSTSVTEAVDPVTEALRATGLSDLADRPVTQLSGGERQRLSIAQTLAQDTPTLLLDEPLNNLDLNHQLETMQLLRTLNSEGRTVVIVVHDLNMAAQYCDGLVLLDRGLIAAQGSPEEVLDARLILEVFKTRVTVHRQGRRPYVTPVWSEPAAAPSHDLPKVHVIAGGGAATGLIEELVMRGATPTVGVVSVFDTDYATAERYELEIVSAPPFEAFSTEAMREFDRFAGQADVIIIAPVFFGQGNLAPLRSTLDAAKRGVDVIVIDRPPIGERDLTGGEAVALVTELGRHGTRFVETPAQAADAACAEACARAYPPRESAPPGRQGGPG